MADLTEQDDMTKRTCSVDGCNMVHAARGRCRYRHNEAYFDVVDTEEKAYWLGFIAADGCVRTEKGFNLLQIKLKDSDAGHVEKFRAAIASDHPIHFAERRGVAGASATLAISSPHMVAALGGLGIRPRKSLTATPWDGSANLMRHYWRGLFDGDGCISRAAKRNVWSMTLCGSFACIEAFASWAEGVCGSTSKPFLRTNTWYWKVAGLGAPQALARELYGGAVVSLGRKQELADVLLDETPIAHGPYQAMDICEINGCSKRARSRHMCMYHYRRSWVASGPDCAVAGCVKKRFARSYCASHYNRLVRGK